MTRKRKDCENCGCEIPVTRNKKGGETKYCGEPCKTQAWRRRKEGRPTLVEEQRQFLKDHATPPPIAERAQGDRIELLLNKVYSQGVALFSKIHNLEVQISTLKTQTAKTLALLATESELSEDERRAVVNDFVHQVTAKKK